MVEPQIKEIMMKSRVFSATRASGRLHLGNYLGAVKGYLALQERSDLECVFMAVDLHTITTPYDAKTLPQASREIIIDYLAAGLDPERVVVTLQSLVSEHSELAFLFSSVVSIARMQHLPTFKDKVKQHPNHVTMALLNYPLLMAADILVYKAGLVPVGIDQEPHLEVAREIARKMNELYGMDFPEPQRFATRGEYVPSLAGAGKMSKSVEGSYINLTDDLATIKKRLAGAPTDSGRGETIPTQGGVANLLKFVELIQGADRRAEYEASYQGAGLRYGDLKNELAAAIFAELAPIQERRRTFEADPKKLEEIIQTGATKARAIASITLKEVKTKMGLG
ncbi:MAG TPA: tryptophan--tRNA ligase [Candidatus Pacebacteria bacterium]|nr:tryptophan--tRNA ligase [Candidatus Paceibacterota bacterium]